MLNKSNNNIKEVFLTKKKNFRALKIITIIIKKNLKKSNKESYLYVILF